MIVVHVAVVPPRLPGEQRDERRPSEKRERAGAENRRSGDGRRQGRRHAEGKGARPNVVRRDGREAGAGRQQAQASAFVAEDGFAQLLRQGRQQQRHLQPLRAGGAIHVVGGDTAASWQGAQSEAAQQAQHGPLDDGHLLDLRCCHDDFLARHQAAPRTQRVLFQTELVAVEAQERGAHGQQQEDREPGERDSKQHRRKQRRA